MLRRITLATLIALAVAPAAAHATSVLVVDDDGAQCPDAGFSNLATAVNYAQSHDTIQICPGTYVTPATGLKIDKTLTIDGAGASKVTIEPPSSTSLGNGNYADATGSVITITNTAPGSTADTDVNPLISGVTIVDNGDTVDSGITFNNAAGTITASRIGPFTGAGSGWGVVASNNEAVTPFGAFTRDVTVSGDLITGYGKGGVLVDGSEASKAFYFRSGITTTAAISNNVITGTTGPAQQYGVQVNAGARAAISGNQITGNVGTTPGTGTNPGTGVGILLTDADVTSTVFGSTTNYYTKIGSNNLTGNGYGIFNGTPGFADGPVGAPADAPTAPPTFPYLTYVNGTGFTPTSTQLPATLHNTTESSATVSIDNSYDVPGVAVQGATPAANWYGAASGPLRGQPSSGSVDAISAATTAGTDNDSVIAGTARTTPYTTPAAPAVVSDAAPMVSWGTPSSTGSLVGGQATQLLVKAKDDFGITSVHVTAGSDDLGTLTHTPYSVDYTPSAGLIGQSITLTAVATDEAGQTTTTTVSVPVVAPPRPPVTTPPSSVTTTPAATATPPTTIPVATPLKPTPASLSPSATVSGKVAALSVTCSSSHASTCTVTVTLTAKVGGKTITIGTKTVKLADGRKTTVKVTLSGAGRRALAKAKGHKLAATVQLTVAGHHKTTKVTLKGR